MKPFNPPRIFTFLFYVHWLIDLSIAVISFFFVLIIARQAILNPQIVELGELILSLVAMLYGVSSFLIKLNNDLRESEALESEAINIFENCRNVILAHYLNAEEYTHKAKDQVLATYLDDWKKHKSLKPFEYQLMDGYLNHIVSGARLGESDKLFLKYRIVSSTMTSYFPLLITEIENGDFFTDGTAHNRFIKKIHSFANQTDINKADELVLDNETIQDTINYALKKSNPVMEKLLQERESRDRVQYLLHKCYENAYSNIGNLDQELSDDARRNLVLLYKYDERFSILKLSWRTEIKKQLSTKYATRQELDEEFAKEKLKLDNIIMPQPFSRAISDFDYCIERVAPKDSFLFVVYPEKFGADANGWSVEKFMHERVILRGKQYLADFNKRLVKEYPYLKKLQKRTLDANYYLFHFNRQHFEYNADQDSIPTAIKRFLIKSILESENAPDHLASQLVYIKQVIKNITISGLLFTESLDLQKSVQGKESEILKKARKSNLIISNVHEIASLGNQVDLFIKILFEAYHGRKLKRKFGKDFEFAKNTAEKIVENAKEILQVFETLKTSS